ncbi:MAG: MFS transporter [Paludibacteraceae bacterium]|nr:MFS transporter [Paludibacteraceae bacterium]
MSSFTSLYATNLFGTLNDNFMKTLASFVAIRWVDERWQSLMVSVAAAALVLPYVLCSPLAGRLTQVMRKQKIVRIAKACEIPIVLVVIMGFVMHSFYLVIGGLLLMGLQSSLYSPAKYGLIRDIGGVERVSSGMGGMEAVAFVGMLTGTVLAGVLVDTTPAWLHYVLLALFALAGWLCSLTIRAQETPVYERESINPVRFLRNAYRLTKQYAGLHRVVITLCIFWWMAATIQMGMLVYCQRVLHTSSVMTGVILAAAAIGISLGSVFAGHIDRSGRLLPCVPLLITLVSVALLLLFLLRLPVLPLGVLLFVVAFVAGCYKLPLDAEIQRVVRPEQLGIVLACFNQLSFIFILIASGTFALITLWLPIRYMFLMMSIVLLFSALYVLFGYRRLLCMAFRGVFGLRYDVRTIGMDVMQQQTPPHPHLIMPNHQAVMDPMLLFCQLADYSVRPLVDEAYFSTWFSRLVLSRFGAVRVPEMRGNRNADDLRHVRHMDRLVSDALQDCQDILFYPSGHITLDGQEHIGNRHLAYNVCRSLPADTRIILVRISGLWGSIWSRKGVSRTPNLPRTLLRSMWLVMTGYTLRHPRRRVIMQFADMTTIVRQWADTCTRQQFNQRLEDWYNQPLQP